MGVGVGVAGAAAAADPVEQGRRGTPASEELPATPTAAWSVSSLQAPLHLSGCFQACWLSAGQVGGREGPARHPPPEHSGPALAPCAGHGSV